MYLVNHIGVYDYLAAADKWTWYSFAGKNRIADLKDGIPHYYVTDHLGNTRVKYRTDFTCSSSTAGSLNYKIENINEYYAYGKTLREYVNSNAEKYLTSYHERDKETSLDYRGARYYDSEIGRFLTVDPLANKYFNINPYVYVANNPIIFTDPNGKTFQASNKEGLMLIEDMFASFMQNPMQTRRNIANLFGLIFSEEVKNYSTALNLKGLKGFEKHAKSKGFNFNDEKLEAAYKVFQLLNVKVTIEVTGFDPKRAFTYKQGKEIIVVNQLPEGFQSFTKNDNMAKFINDLGVKPGEAYNDLFNQNNDVYGADACNPGWVFFQNNASTTGNDSKIVGQIWIDGNNEQAAQNLLDAVIQYKP